MGDNQSKPQNNRASYNAQTQQRNPQSSEEMLQQRQRRFYEQRLRETEQELPRTPEERALDELLRQQVQAVEISQQQNILIQGGLSSPQAQGSERNRAPYNFTQSDLQRNRETVRPVSQTASPTLYPNLNNMYTTSQSLSNTPRQRDMGYVFVNSNQQSPGGVIMSNFLPSAPPEPEPTPHCGNQSRGLNNKTNKNKPAGSSFRPADCSTCGNSYGVGKIYQCAGDKKSIRHSSCVNCKIANKQCGICGAPISNMRNLGLENKLGDLKLKVPCPYNCDRTRVWSTVGTVDTIDDHKKECPMRVLQCPVSGPAQCAWTGKIVNLSSHINDVHPDCRRSVDTEIQLKNIDQHTKSFIELDGTGPFKFLFHTKVNVAERKIFMAVQLYTTRSDKNTWYYEIHVFNKSEPRRKILYSDVCQPSFTPVEDIFRQYKCVSIPISYAMTYFNEGSLTYKIYIKSNYQPSEPGISGWKGRKDNRGKTAAAS